MGLLDWLNPLNGIAQSLERAYVAREQAKNDKDRIAAEVSIKELEARRDVVIAASINDRWWSPRTIMGWCATVYVAKLVVWDTVLGWGVTPDPGEQVTWIVMTVLSFYFMAKGAETVARSVADAMNRRSK